MLVIHDEVELAFGDVRLKEGQGLGGHNGLRSLERSFGSRDFWRLRVGVGRPDSPTKPLIDHVLAPFDEPREHVQALIGRAADLAEEWLAARGDGSCPA
jgi:PTH1 family peptidyl-tRNA hydrolase